MSVLWLSACLIIGSVYADELPTATTSSGLLEGKLVKGHNGKDVEVYLGVPYAQPPIGDLRFAPPVPVHPWEGTRAARSPGNQCPQSEFLIHDDQNRNDDCLYLNVWTPHPRPANAPVLVFFHGRYGRSFRFESGTFEKFDGTQLAEEQGLVVITTNYRVSELGFFYLGTPDAPGNVGIQDQALVLKWVQDNVAGFGGDPKRVTAFGDEAGGFFLGYQTFIPSSKGLFQNLILLDGYPNMKNSTKSAKQSLQLSYRLAEELGCGTSAKDPSQILSCVRAKPLKEVVMASHRAIFLKMEYFGPVIDGELISNDPSVALELTHFDPELKIMLGVSRNRGSLGYSFVTQKPLDDLHYINKAELRNLVTILVGKPGGLAVEGLIDQYTDWEHPGKPSSIRASAVNILSDTYMYCPVSLFADHFSASGNEVYLFHFSQRSEKSQYPEWAGVVEGEPIDYIFGHAVAANNYTEEEHKLSHDVMQKLGNFARTGDPNEKDQESWERYNLRNKPFYELKIGGKTKYHMRAKKCAFWNRTYKRLLMADELIASLT